MDDTKIPVECSVENCKYNKDKLCHAENLEIKAMGDGIAESTLGTCCSTFKNAESNY